jgi:hypothetical protein
MTHPLITKVSSAIDGGYAQTNHPSYVARVDGYSLHAIETVLDDLIACFEFRQRMNELRADSAGAEQWAMVRAWLANRKDEVLT